MSGAQCCENPPNSTTGGGGGHVEEIGGLKCYVSGLPDSKLAILFISDIFGYEAPNLRKFADKVGGAGFYVVVPDFFNGDYFVPGNSLNEWLKHHGPEQGFEHAKPIIEALKSKGITQIGAAGFCWGAKVVVLLGQDAYIQAAVLLHPSLVSVDDIQRVKIPISVLGAEIDQMSPPKLLKQFEETLNAKPEVDCFVKIFPGVSHGWSVRYKEEDEVAVKCAVESHQDTLDWFTKYLK